MGLGGGYHTNYLPGWKNIVEEYIWNTVVLLPKGNGEFQVILLLKFIWKTVLGVVNHQIGVAVNFYNTLHGLWVVRGTGTNFLEANLLHQLIAIREEVLYKILIDLQKA